MPHILTLAVNAEKTVTTKDDGKHVKDYAPERLNLGTKKDRARLEHILKYHNHTTNLFDGPRNADNNAGVTGIMLDVDNKTVPCVTIEELQRRFARYVYVIYTTSSHTPDHPKLRVLLPFAEVVPKEKAKALYAWMKRTFADPEYDSTCFEAGRHYYPCCEPGRVHFECVINAKGECYPVPDLTGLPEATTHAQPPSPEPDITPDEYKLKRTRFVKDLWKLDADDLKRGDSTAFLLALDCKRSGDTFGEAEQKLLEWNAASVDPMDEERVTAKVKNVYNRSYAYIPPPTAFDDPNLRKLLLMDEPAFSEADRAEILRLYNLIFMTKKVQRTDAFDPILWGEDLFDEEPEPLERIGVLFFKDMVTMFWGEEKDGKSWLIFSDLWNIVRTQPKHRAIWVSSDEPLKSIKRRFNIMRPCMGNVGLIYKPLNPVSIVAHVYRHKPTLLVFDSIASVFSTLGLEMPENSRPEDVHKLMLFLPGFIEHTSVEAIVVTEHAIRDGSRYRGSGAKGAAVDIIIGMDANKPKCECVIELEGRDIEDAKETYAWKGHDIGYDVTCDLKKHPDSMKKISELEETDVRTLALLLEAPRDRAELVKSLGVVKSVLTRVKERLMEKELVTVRTGKARSEQWSMPKRAKDQYRTAIIERMNNLMSGGSARAALDE